MNKRNIILCEGFDEVYILGYYLFKTDSWKISSKNKKFSEYYSLPEVNPRNQLIEIYEKNDNKLAIWSVGGKNNFLKAFKYIKEINFNHPDYRIEQVFIIQDRDNSEICEAMNDIQTLLMQSNIVIEKLNNNTVNNWIFEVEDEIYSTHIIPIVLPFDEKGAIETLLMKAISEDSDEERYIVEEAKKYIDNFLTSERRLNNYLQHKRDILKAKFSSVISVTNPNRSTATFDKLLMSHSWENKEEIKRHFSLLNKFL